LQTGVLSITVLVLPQATHTFPFVFTRQKLQIRPEKEMLAKE
jgi:ABC-type uncharacterized transport system substrate-binding protein